MRTVQLGGVREVANCDDALTSGVYTVNGITTYAFISCFDQGLQVRTVEHGCKQRQTRGTPREGRLLTSPACWEKSPTEGHGTPRRATLPTRPIPDLFARRVDPEIGQTGIPTDHA